MISEKKVFLILIIITYFTNAMQFNKLTFEDIMQRKILFYDQEKEQACKIICSTLYIDYLPSITGGNYFELIKGKFVMKEITLEKQLNSQDRIFDKKLLQKFKLNKHNVLFVFEGSVLQGIVHISDYNHDVVIQSIQDDILVFERHIRQLLILKGFTNKDFLEFADSLSRKDDHWRNRLKVYNKRIKTMEEFGAFQMFDFSDLLYFFKAVMSDDGFRFSSVLVNNKRVEGINLLSSLRNLAMHGKNPITTENHTDVYSMSSMEGLFERLAYFEDVSNQLLYRLKSNPDYIKAIKLDNANKLDIIHTHHPKALWYFIGKD